MHYLLVGPGALGCLLYALMAKGMHQNDRFTVLDYNRERAELLSRRGVIYQCGAAERLLPVTTASDPETLEPVDVVLLCVKSYDVKNSLDFCAPILGEKTLLLFLQNGISHLELDTCGHKAYQAYGTTTEGATLLGPGHVRHAGSGTTSLGFITPPDEHFKNLLQKTADTLTRSGLQVNITGDILARIWTKLFINVGINALTATLNCKNGELLTLPGVDKRMRAAVEEARLVAAAQDIIVPVDPFDAARQVCRNTAGNISSMLQDVRKKRRTEIDAINGAIVLMAREHGISTPENDRLVKQVKELEATYENG
ncbi:ketopantoate reductase family protein [Desulforhopalus singaporensis]|uniref:2-dehydropantoate 2-reductase n=1 Tax=Desulforhopalus singaporensis TaxID=91360 RepID=A0A1H0M324_9BACT|nr:2-dehydropantoate 2-reductase [Desulforhopalus singaporensis]SDO74803.1 ketopantoate reductase [Desulforhopalus singaporensis]